MRKNLHLRPIPPPTDPPALRIDAPLPLFRYLPGLQRHPSQHDDIHVPAVDPAAWRCTPLDRRFQRGLDLFDRRFYWEAHEVWEELWHELDRDEPFSQLVQGLIQCAAATLARHAGREAAAGRLLGRAARRFGLARSSMGERPGGVDTAALLAAIGAFLAGGDYPSVP